MNKIKNTIFALALFCNLSFAGFFEDMEEKYDRVEQRVISGFSKLLEQEAVRELPEHTRLGITEYRHQMEISLAENKALQITKMSSRMSHENGDPVPLEDIAGSIESQLNAWAGVTETLTLQLMNEHISSILNYETYKTIIEILIEDMLNPKNSDQEMAAQCLDILQVVKEMPAEKVGAYKTMLFDAYDSELQKRETARIEAAGHAKTALDSINSMNSDQAPEQTMAQYNEIRYVIENNICDAVKQVELLAMLEHKLTVIWNKKFG